MTKGYLVHQHIGYALIRALESRQLSPDLAVLAACGLSAMLAAALTYGVERPCRAWLKERLSTRLANAGAPATLGPAGVVFGPQRA